MQEHDDFSQWRAHIESRLDTQEKLLTEVRDAFRASKLGAHALAWMAGIGSAVAIIWANLHGFK